jgi:tripartite-type tricarboxylate transporter receptor subunit TctC
MNAFSRPEARILAAALAVALACTAAAQERPRSSSGYPAKAIHLIVPFPAGGATDILGRAVGERLAARLGQSMVVDNKPGAGANIGAEAAAKSPPDGYTLLMGSVASHSIALSYYKALGYDVRRDLTPISMVGYVTNVLVVAPSLPARTVQEVIAYAKANPGKVNFASSGTGGLIHLTGEMFKAQAGIDIVHVPYKGTALFLPDLMDGRVSMTLDTLPPYMTQIKSGKVRAIAVTTSQRSPAMPDLPTVSESGLPGFESVAIYGLFAPTGTPKVIVDLLNREAVAVLKQPDLKEKLAVQGIEIASSTPEALGVVVRNEVAKWAKVIKDAQIKPE